MSLTMPPAAQIEVWRQKVKEGTITIEELRDAVKLIRDGRLSAGAAKPRAAATGGRRSTDIDPQAAEDLLKELGEI